MIVDRIPYLGNNSYEIIAKLRKSKARETRTYKTMFEFILTEALQENTLLVISSGLKVQIAWLRDAMFNYRDGEAFVPYFDYDVITTSLPPARTLSKGHLLLNKDNTQWLLRYNFKLKKFPLAIGTKIRLFNTTTLKKYNVIVENWYNDTFDMDELWAYYILSSYKDEDRLLYGFEPGYTYISRQFKGFTNYEHQIRKSLELRTYETYYENEDYTDVRHYRYTELFKDKLNSNANYYKLRRLKFDCLLYSIIQSGALPTDERTRERYKKLSQQECIMCYKPTHRDDPALIFKSYWFGIGSYANKRAITRKV